jgi:hypothetical protein
MKDLIKLRPQAATEHDISVFSKPTTEQFRISITLSQIVATVRLAYVIFHATDIELL